MFSLANYAHGQVATTGAMSSFSVPGILCGDHIYWQTMTPFVGETATIAKEPHNEPDPTQ